MSDTVDALGTYKIYSTMIFLPIAIVLVLVLGYCMQYYYHLKWKADTLLVAKNNIADYTVTGTLVKLADHNSYTLTYKRDEQLPGINTTVNVTYNPSDIRGTITQDALTRTQAQYVAVGCVVLAVVRPAIGLG